MENKLILIASLLIPCLFECDKNKEEYKYLGQIAPYLHQIEYDDYEFDKDWLTVTDCLSNCSTVRNGNFIGRNKYLNS